MDALHLSRTVLEWAADLTGNSLDQLARKISKRKSDRIAVGEVTTAQAIKIAQLPEPAVIASIGDPAIEHFV
jgi:hypothetical protein